MVRRCEALAIGLALGVLAGCAQRSGPVLGAWRGAQPYSSFVNPAQLDLELDGEPGAQTGAYHLTWLDADPTSLRGHDQEEWGGTWVRSQSTQDGRVLTIITLKDILPKIIGSYALFPDNTLHALDPNGRLDSTPAGALYTLRPVAVRKVG